MPDRLDPKRARQGERGTPILKVLIVALALALLAWGVAEIFGEASDPAGGVADNTIEESDDGASDPAGPPTVDE